MQDGRQRGEVQLSITFQPAGAVQSPTGPPQASHMHPHPTPSTDVLTYTPRSTSDPCSSDDSKAVSLSTAGNQSIVEGVPLPDQADLGPLGKSLMALSMTHISPSRQQAPTHHSTNSSSSVTRLSRDVAPSAVDSLAAIPGSEASSSAAAHAAAPQGAAANAVPARRNFYPEEIVDNDPPHSWAASHQSAHSCSGDVMPHGFRLQQASDGLASDGDVGNASYSAREVYAHQYRISPDPVDYLQHKLAAQSMQQQQQQHIGKSSHCNQSFSAGQGSFHQSGQFAAMQADQGALQQPFMPNFHIMGTTPLHDGQQKQHPLQQTQGFNALDYSPHQTYGHHVRQPDAFIPVPAWRLMGTSPLHDGHHANDHAALDQHIDSGERGLTYADMAVKSWSSQARQPSVPYRNAHYNDHQARPRQLLSACAPGILQIGASQYNTKHYQCYCSDHDTAVLVRQDVLHLQHHHCTQTNQLTEHSVEASPQEAANNCCVHADVCRAVQVGLQCM